MAKQDFSFDQIIRDLQNKKYAPVYLLMGEEPYYIDKISDFIQNNILDDSQREFDQLIVYGKDIEIDGIITAARRFPMISPYQILIVKEAQHIKELEKMEIYLQNIPKTTILVICYKYGTVDGRRKWITDLKKAGGIVYESVKLRDYEMSSWISKYASGKNIQLDDKAVLMLCDFLGTDLGKVANELDKLAITNPSRTRKITPEIIERNIGFSKDFNVFELLDALISNDKVKAFKIIRYFAENKKANPIQMVIAQLFGFFSNLMIFHYLPIKTAEAAASELRVHPFVAKSYVKAAQRFNAWKTMNIISLIRETDARSKGVENVATDDGDLMKELIYKILY